MNIQISLALRYLQDRRLRTTLTTLAIIIGVMILFGLGSIIPAMSQVFRQDVLTSSGKVDLTLTHASAGTFGADQLNVVRHIDGIAPSTGSLRQNISLPASLSVSGSSGKALNAVTVIGLDPATAPGVRAYPLVTGRFLAAGDSLAMVLPESMARSIGKMTGDHITLPSAEGTADFTIVGIVGTRVLPGAEEVYVPLQAAQRLLNKAGQINMIEALFTSGADRVKMQNAAQAALGDNFRLTPIDEGSNVFSSAMEISSKAMSLIGILALAMGGFVIFNTFRTIVAERRRDLGMLRALGATRRTVLGLIMVESLIQGVIGTALGLVAGYGLAMLTIAAINPIMREYWNRQISAPPITASNLITAVVLGVGITVLSGLLPARAATRVTPLEALRPSAVGMEAGPANRRTLIAVIIIAIAALTLISGNVGLAALGALLFLIGLVAIAPALVTPLVGIFSRLIELAYAREGSIARGNVTRQPGRAAVTASSVMIALAIIVAAAGLLSSVFGSILSYSEKSLGADYLIMPSSLVLSGGNVGAGSQLADQVHNTPGIGAVTTLRLASATINNQAIQVIGIDPISYGQIAGLVFNSGNEKDAYAALAGGRAVILNGILAGQAQLKVGDTFQLETAEGKQAYRVAGIGLDYLNVKIATAYISQANLASDFHQTSDVLLMANRATGADTDALRTQLDKLVSAYPTFTLLDSATFRANQQRTLNSMMWMLSIMMIALIAPGLIAMINTLAIGVIERTREIGMLRAVGSTRKQIRRMIQAESLLLAALGTAFGLLAGLWLGYVLVGSMSVMGFIVAYQIPFGGLLVGIAAGLLLGVLAAVVPARQAAKMDIIEALRYE